MLLHGDHCVGSVVRRSVGSGHPCSCPGDLKNNEVPRPAVKLACNPLPVSSVTTED